MYKPISELSDEEKISLFLTGMSGSYYQFGEELKNYQRLKDETELCENDHVEKEILDLLEQLGYPMDLFGTYLYKDIIVDARNRLHNIKRRDDIIKCKYYIMDLKEFFSGLYFTLARFERDIGIKTFHKHIELSISNIDMERADKELIHDIYSNFPDAVDYGENAFILGAYLNKIIVDNEENNYDMPTIKCLSGSPDCSLKLKV